MLQFLGIWLAFGLLTSCVSGGEDEKGPIVEYNGVGLHQSDDRPTLVSGTVQYKNFSGGELKVEARRSVPCPFGRCPIVGEPPVAQKKLEAPGPYSLELPQSAKDLMLIAMLKTPDGRARVAHLWLQSEASEVTGVDLSLDRPHAPLR